MAKAMKIAIVDDEQDMRQSISQWLALSGYDTETYPSAEEALKKLGFILIGLDGEADRDLPAALADTGTRPVGLVLGAEGPGLREKTRETCDMLARIPFAGSFGSLNVSNAAAVSLYAATRRGAGAP